MDIRNTFTATVKHSLNGLLVSLMLLPSISLALPLEYTASYDIEKFGIVVAQSNYSLKHENNGVRITQHSEPVGFAALFRNDELDENSFVSDLDGQLLLTEFSYDQKSPDKKNRSIQIKIDWTQSDGKLSGKVIGTAHGKKLKLNVKNPVWDTSSYQIPLMRHTKEGAEPQAITMMIKGQFKEYKFITHNIEEIEVNGSTIKAIKTERDDGKSNSPIYMWLAPSLNNLPVKIEKWKNGKLELTMLLNKARFTSDKTMKFNASVEDHEELDDL